MNLLKFLQMFGRGAALESGEGSLGMWNDLHSPEAAMSRFDEAEKKSNPQTRIMDAFEAYKSGKKSDRLMLSPQSRIDQAFGMLPGFGSMRDMAATQVGQGSFPAPAPAPGPVQTARGPGVDLARPAAYVPQGEAGVAPEPADAGIPWWQRNGMMQTDPETGQPLDPQMAARARGVFG